MENALRLIPRLDIKGPNVVKGIHLEGLRVLGNPYDFAKYYYENGADEIFYQDVVASLFERNSLADIIRQTAKDIFIPLTVGGGLRTLDDIENVLLAGADKVALNTAVINDPTLISAAAEKFGSSTIVISIECIKQDDGNHLAFTDNGREHTGKEVVSWARECEELGAGEILLTSVDKEGTGEGFDVSLISDVCNSTSIPIVAHGGAGELEHFEPLKNISLSGIAMASILHYETIKNREFIDDDKTSAEGNKSFLNRRTGFSVVESQNIKTIKDKLSKLGFTCRPT